MEKYICNTANVQQVGWYWPEYLMDFTLWQTFCLMDLGNGTSLNVQHWTGKCKWMEDVLNEYQFDVEKRILTEELLFIYCNKQIFCYWF